MAVNSTYNRFRPLIDQAKRDDLPLGMVKEVLLANKTRLKAGDAERFYPGSDTVMLPKSYLNAAGTHLEYMPVRFQFAYTSAINRYKPLSTDWYPICHQPNGVYNELFHAWWKQVMNDDKHTLRKKWVMSRFGNWYSNSEHALQECWSETTDCYIKNLLVHAMNRFSAVWSGPESFPDHDYFQMMADRNESIGGKPPYNKVWKRPMYKFRRYPRPRRASGKGWTVYRRHAPVPTRFHWFDEDHKVGHPKTVGLKLSRVQITHIQWVVLKAILEKGIRAVPEAV